MVVSDLPELVQSMGVNKAVIIDVSEITFDPVFRQACEANSCGFYGKCWMCPPDVGEIDDLIADAKGYEHVLVYQTIGMLEDSFDIEGMQDAAKNHNIISIRLAEVIGPSLNKYLHLGAGSCQICDKCAKRENEPCKFPELAMPSLEAYGIAVSELAKACGMNYINGQNTVTYFGAFFFN